MQSFFYGITCLLIITFSMPTASLGSKPALKPNSFYTDSQQIALTQAAATGDIKTIDRLVKKGVNVNAKGKCEITPLFFALYAKNIAGFRRLLEHRASPNVALTKTTEEVKGALYINAGQSPMSLAAGMLGDSTFLKACLKHGGKVNFVDPNFVKDPKKGNLQKSSWIGGTPIFSAINSMDGPDENIFGNRNIENVKLLIKAGANLNHQSESGMTPVHFAVMNNHYRAAYELLLAGADHRITTDDKLSLARTCLICKPLKHFKSFKEDELYYKKVIALLKKKGVDFAAVQKALDAEYKRKR